MALSFSITPADSADYLTIAKLHALVFNADLIMRVLFPNDPYFEAQTAWILEILRRTEAEPHARCVKAIDDCTGRLVGAAILQIKPAQNPPIRAPFTMIQNTKFYASYFPQARKFYEEKYGNEKHACEPISFFGVRCGEPKMISNNG